MQDFRSGGREARERLARRYPTGTRIELQSLCNYEPGMNVGLRGAVVGHDDQPSLLMAWDNGRSLSVFPGEDCIRILTPEEIALEQAMSAKREPEASQTAPVLEANGGCAIGKTLIMADNIEIDEELFMEDDHVNAYVAAYFDVDERFGTATYGTDDYVNVYANYFPETGELEFGYTLIKSDGSDSDFIAVELADSERDAVLGKMKAAGLDECVAEMQEEGLEMSR